MAGNCPECIKNIVELHDGWIATQVELHMWKLEHPQRHVGIATFNSLDEIQDYLKELVIYE